MVIIGTLYIRRRSQLLRETQRDSECWKQYIKLRSTLLQFHYGASNFSSTTEVISSSCGDLSQTVSRVSNKQYSEFDKAMGLFLVLFINVNVSLY